MFAALQDAPRGDGRGAMGMGFKQKGRASLVATMWAATVKDICLRLLHDHDVRSQIAPLEQLRSFRHF